MKHRALATLLFAAAALSAAPLSAQTLSGTWQITSEGRRGPTTQTLVLTQDGATLTGTITLGGGGGRGGGRGGGGGGGGGGALAGPMPISEGSVTGNAFRFSMTVDFNGNSFAQQFSGTFDGNTMTGTVDGGRGGARPFTGTRGS